MRQEVKGHMREKCTLWEQSSAEPGLRQAQGQAHCNTAHIKGTHLVSNNIVPHVKNIQTLWIVPLWGTKGTRTANEMREGPKKKVSSAVVCLLCAQVFDAVKGTQSTSLCVLSFHSLPTSALVTPLHLSSVAHLVCISEPLSPCHYFHPTLPCVTGMALEELGRWCFLWLHVLLQVRLEVAMDRSASAWKDDAFLHLYLHWVEVTSLCNWQKKVTRHLLVVVFSLSLVVSPLEHVWAMYIFKAITKFW